MSDAETEGEYILVTRRVGMRSPWRWRWDVYSPDAPIATGLPIASGHTRGRKYAWRAARAVARVLGADED